MSEDGKSGDDGQAIARLRNRALKLLAGREHSEKELLQKLSRTPRAAPRSSKRTNGSAPSADADLISTENGFDAEHHSASATSQTPSPTSSKERATQLLTALKDAGYQSDDRYAAALTRQYAGKLSRNAIAGKLKAAGIARETITQSLDEQLDDANTDDYALATKLWQGKFRTPPTDQKEKAKHVRFLQSRGISISVALKVLKAAGAGVEEE
jgi:regulatory protein